MLVRTGTNEHPLACRWKGNFLKGRESAKCKVAHSDSPLLRLQLPPKLPLHVEPTLATFLRRHISNRQKHGGGHRNIRGVLGGVLDEFDQISLCAFLEAETQQKGHWQRTLLELSGQFVSSSRTSFCLFLSRIFPWLRDRTITHKLWQPSKMKNRSQTRYTEI